MALTVVSTALTPTLQRNKQLLESGDFSDFTLGCGGKDFKVHKAVVCLQSPYLRTICDANFREAKDSRASLQEQDPEILQKVLDFLYTETYDDAEARPNALDHASPEAQTLSDEANDTLAVESYSSEGLATDSSSVSVSDLAHPVASVPAKTDHQTLQSNATGLLLHVRIYKAADYLQIEPLKRMAVTRCTDLMNAVFDAESFATAISEALEDIRDDDVDLRPQIIRACLEHVENVKKCQVVQHLLRTHEPVAWKLLTELQEKHNAELQVLSGSMGRLLDEIDDLRNKGQDNKDRYEVAEQEVADLRSEISRIARAINKRTECRNMNCDQKFGAELETSYRGFEVLRCRKCRCRHSDQS